MARPFVLLVAPVVLGSLLWSIERKTRVRDDVQASAAARSVVALPRWRLWSSGLQRSVLFVQSHAGIDVRSV